MSTKIDYWSKILIFVEKFDVWSKISKNLVFGPKCQKKPVFGQKCQKMSKISIFGQKR